MKIDLHIHSTASDGRLTPREVVKLAKENNIKCIAITDHNTMEGVKEAQIEGKKLGVRVIAGVELSTRYKGKQIHLLGYFRKGYNEVLVKEILSRVRRQKVDEIEEVYKGKLNIKKGDKRLDVKDGIALLKSLGAKIFIAHPVKILEEDLKEIVKLGIDGIEAIHPRHTDEKIKYFINFAIKNKIKYSAGSDFHKKNSKNPKHGTIGEFYLEVSKLREVL
ncbi:PHP domain-containing protein [uncultured Clostridium sp.]|uniref:PHP domain-containing protein n=1 Tax=uncultured Clostridium sp. TaxID=59620 RepID=UPI002618526D|nr:PHP domain-containing protein [uncultured Clostridium sp.]